MNEECANITNEKKWKRNCPDCGREIFHTEKWVRDKFVRLNKPCTKCKQKGNRSSNFGKHLSEEVRRKISTSIKGENCYWFGKKLSEETKEKISKIKFGTKQSEETKKKISISNIGNQYRKGIPHTAEIKRKIRLTIISKLQNRCGKFSPNFSQKGCEYFQWLNMWYGWNGQYAINGGEYFIKDLGYWVDYYDPKENVVIEWDEKYHYNIDGQLKKRDNDRMVEIKDHLKCRFMRFNEKLNEIKEY